MTFAAPLLEKYSRPGPRYTSYPTAPSFTEDFNEAAWLAELQQTQNSGRGLSLYVHIPFWDSLYYCDCNMVTTQNYAKATSYLTYGSADLFGFVIPAQAGIQLNQST